MLDKIRTYIDNSFTGINETKKVKELKDELFENLKEKYNDQIQDGKTEQEAYNSVISGIGDLSELIESVKEPYSLPSELIEEKKKRALRASIAVALFIISPFLFVVSIVSFSIEPTIAILLMLILIALGVGLLVYNQMTRTNYALYNDNLSNKFKEFEDFEENYNHINPVYKSFINAYWIIIVAIYLITSILFNIWSFSWILFIIGAAGINIFKGIIQLKCYKEDDKYE
ncbi:TPA: permease prefix domain 1-containing protein [Clostridioides difficile]|uniref:permease prefix domain 1-containing protein n=1 Tax=Clostridioides difficile TaxID=1496 RepID=UPI0010B7615B|nr:permease prefix domain 1-containing protein [Clostridioides difficile]MDL0414529.1 permease prefix domain 1-containing protein [Clostridioides difficile]VHY40593.1 pentapeptide repeat-containing protein [Clostridioides difficile]